MNFQRALITGASSGLGKALAQALAEHGIPLLLTGRERDQLSALAASLPVHTEWIAKDLAVASEKEQLLQWIHSRIPDLIINNAGFGLYGQTLELPLQEQMQMIDLNVKALMEITIESARALIAQEKKGTIINISSAAGLFPYPTFSVYAASKACVNSFSQALDHELKNKGVRVLTVCPGSIETQFRKRASRDFPQRKEGSPIPLTRAVQLILCQIQTQKRFCIIDWRYRIGARLLQLLPTPQIMKWLQKQISGRFTNRPLA